MSTSRACQLMWLTMLLLRWRTRTTEQLCRLLLLWWAQWITCSRRVSGVSQMRMCTLTTQQSSIRALYSLSTAVHSMFIHLSLRHNHLPAHPTLASHSQSAGWPSRVEGQTCEQAWWTREITNDCQDHVLWCSCCLAVIDRFGLDQWQDNTIPKKKPLSSTLRCDDTIDMLYDWSMDLISDKRSIISRGPDCTNSVLLPAISVPFVQIV